MKKIIIIGLTVLISLVFFSTQKIILMYNFDELVNIKLNTNDFMNKNTNKIEYEEIEILDVQTSFSELSVVKTEKETTEEEVSLSSYENSKIEFGLTIDDDFKPYLMSDFKTLEYKFIWRNQYDDNDDPRWAYSIEVQNIVLKDERSNNYAFVYRIVPSNGETYKQCGFLWKKKCWGSSVWTDYVNVLVELNEDHNLKDWQPKNEITTESGSISVAASNDSVGISASYNWSLDDLNIESRVVKEIGYFEINYDYQIISKFSKYSSELFGMFTFDAVDIPTIDIEYSFGAYWEGEFTESKSSGNLARVY